MVEGGFITVSPWTEQVGADDQFAHTDGCWGGFIDLKCTSDKSEVFSGGKKKEKNLLTFLTPLVVNAISVVVFCTVFSWVFL